jgi:hypothetical protein
MRLALTGRMLANLATSLPEKMTMNVFIEVHDGKVCAIYSDDVAVFVVSVNANVDDIPPAFHDLPSRPFNVIMGTAEKPKQIDYCCKHCGSRNVFRDATAQWNVSAQAWVMVDVHDHADCGDCDGETTLQEVEA